ncbi:(2Fe-2S)-binding protein [Streptomyces sp. NPDC056656]|uniref:(2Fe-2S)-binding protein n=1 Tax=Streptomyces sp. NPDC056656 TaxID=3345895 RepID=UPI00369303BF
MTVHIDLRELGSLGGFFALRDSEKAESDLTTLERAYQGDAPARDPLAYRVEKVARALSVPEPRVAVSVAQLGLAARLWSVALGSAALFGSVPDLDPALLHWNPDASAPDDLFLAGTGQLPADGAHLAQLVLDRHLEPLSAALRSRYRVSAPLLRGNAGSALAGAAREISRWARRAGRPDVAARARLLTTELFADPRLAATGTRTGTAFRRTSCCLIYRAPGGGLCGDCCFERQPPPSSPPAASG